MFRSLGVLFVFFICIFTVILCSGCGNKQSVYWKLKVLQFKQVNATLKKGQIVFIGDSITDGYDLDTFFADQDISLKLYNRGIAGDTTRGVIKRMKVSLYDLAPSKIVILIGINDLNGGKSSEYVINNYKEILKAIKRNLPKCKVCIQSIYPVNDDLFDIARNTDKIIKVNSFLSSYAAKNGYTFIDVFSSLKTSENLLNSGYANDGLHPNKSGYDIVTSCLADFLR